MNKVLRPVTCTLRLDCGHIIQSSFRPCGTEVHCPTCADNETRVRAARVGELKRILTCFPSVIADVTYKIAPDYILNRIAELEAECQE